MGLCTKTNICSGWTDMYRYLHINRISVPVSICECRKLFYEMETAQALNKGWQWCWEREEVTRMVGRSEGRLWWLGKTGRGVRTCWCGGGGGGRC